MTVLDITSIAVKIVFNVTVIALCVFFVISCAVYLFRYIKYGSQ